MYVYALYVCLVSMEATSGIKSLKLELQTVISHLVGTWTLAPLDQ